MPYFSKPSVSVIVPTHNRPELLSEALESANAQTFRDFEIIVISNGESVASSMRTQRIAELAGAEWLFLSEGNVSAARNYGISAASGEWIAFLDDDDIWLPEKLERQLAAANGSGADMIVCDRIEFHEDGRLEHVRRRRPEGQSYHRAIVSGKWVAIPSAVLIRRKIILDAGGFDPGFKLCEDGELWRRIVLKGGKIHEMDDFLVRYRRHERAVTHNRRLADWYDLKHIFKARRETPRSLRGELPSAISLGRQLFLRRIMPRAFRQPRKYWERLRPAK